MASWMNELLDYKGMPQKVTTIISMFGVITKPIVSILGNSKMITSD
jgi:hypothetical protein